MRIIYLSTRKTWEEYRVTVDKTKCLEYKKTEIVFNDINGTSYKWINAEREDCCELRGERADQYLIGDQAGCNWFCENVDILKLVMMKF